MSAEISQIDGAAPKCHAPVDLAREVPFRLGELAVAPGLRELAGADGARQTLEPRVMQVLVALARAEGDIVTRDELIRCCWGGTIVGEDSINRSISLLRRTSEGIGRGAFRIETIPRVGYRLVRVAVPETTTTLPGPAASSRSLGSLWLMAGVVAALVLTALFWPRSPSGPAYSLAIQPFRVLGEPAGFDEELSSALARRNIPSAGGRVKLKLTGSVDKHSDAVVVRARLIDAESDQLVWASAEKLTSAQPAGFAAPSDLLSTVMHCTLAGANDAGRALPIGALSLFARACELIARGDGEQGHRVARQVTKLAPDFAAGWIALAYLDLLRRPVSPEAAANVRREVADAAERMIALRPAAQEGYTYKAVALDRARAVEREQILRRAAQMEPIFLDLAQAFLGDFLVQTGRFEDGFVQYRQVALRSPDVAVNQLRLFLAAAVSGRKPLADLVIGRAEALEPRFTDAVRWQKAVWDGDWAEAERLAPFEHPAQVAAMIATYRALASGKPDRLAAAGRMVVALPDDCCIYLRLQLLTQTGHHREALAALEQFEPGRTPGALPGAVGLFLWDPVLRPLWRDPDIAPFLQRHGWIGYWRDSRSKPDLCREKQPPDFCRLLSADS